MADIISAVQASNLPAAHKTQFIDKWISLARRGGTSALARAGVHGMQAVHTVTEIGSGLVVGSAAGAVHATFGLDKEIGGYNVPMDAVAGVGLAALSIGAAHMPGARQAGSMASQLGTVFSFRKTYDFLATKRKKAGQAVPGTFAGDNDDWSAETNQTQFGDAQSELQNLAAQFQQGR